jgi:predicted ABC-type ATPase
MPTIYVIAGPNGVGKTTFADRYLPNTIKEFDFVNADLIAKGIAPYAPETASIEAGRIALQRIRHLIAAGQSFTWETTMSGRSAAGWLAEAKKSGYTAKGYFLWVADVEMTLRRIRKRVVEGGHSIEPDISRRRFFKTIRNFFAIYRPLFDSWRLFENDETPRLLALEKAGRMVVRDPQRFDRIMSEAEIVL